MSYPLETAELFCDVRPARKTWAERRRATIAILILVPFVLEATISRPALAEGTWAALLAELLAWSLFLLGGMLRFWATLYIGGRKGRTVVCDGPYSIMRNPLYFGNFLMALSVAVSLQSLTLLAALAAAATLYLWATVPSEERRLLGKFGARYREYCDNVPRFWPRLRRPSTPVAVDVDLRCLVLEFGRALRWVCIPLAAEVVMRLRLESWWPQLSIFP